MATGAEPSTLLQRFFPEYSHPPTPPDDYESTRDDGAKTPPMELNNHPPTPDETPQGLKAPRPPLLHQFTSYAESFTTAEEDFSRRPTPVAQNLGVKPQQELINGNGVSDGSVAESDDEGENGRWREIPGAFRNTPSIASSRIEARAKQYMDYQSTPSTKSSKHVRANHCLAVPDDASSTGSSECLARPKSYHEEAESPLGQEGRLGHDGWEDRVSNIRSHDELVKNDDDHANGQAENEPLKTHVTTNDNEDHEHDWDNHVSYISFDEATAEMGNEQSREDAKEEQPASGRLSGQGKRITENGEELKAPSPRQCEDQPSEYATPTEHSPSLRKTGHLVDHQPTSPHVRFRNKKRLHAEVASLRETQLREDQEREAAQALASSRIPHEFLTAPPRNSTDEVYQQIQRQNMERYAALEDPNAVGAVVIPTEDRPHRSLRHMSKQQSLRSINAQGVSDGSPVGKPIPVNRSLRRDLRQVSLAEQHEKPFASPLHHKQRSVSGPIAMPTRNKAPSTPQLRHEKRPLSRTGRHDMQEQQTTPAKRAYTRARFNSQPWLQEKSSSGSELDTEEILAPPKTKAYPRLSWVDQQDGHPRLPWVDQQDARDRELRRSTGKSRIHTNRDIGPPPSTPPPALPTVAPGQGNYLAKTRPLSGGKTPVSTSGMSDKTDIELCEAQNMPLYPHTNESVLVIDQAAQFKSQGKTQSDHNDPPVQLSTDINGAFRTATAPPGQPRFPLQLTHNGDSISTPAVSLLASSAPPSSAPASSALPSTPRIQFIPPTPFVEEDNPLLIVEQLRHRPSFTNRVRRASFGLASPLFGTPIVSRRRSKSVPSPVKKQDSLSPDWTPVRRSGASFWDESDEGSSSDPEDYIATDRLPPGGDTSEHPRQRTPFPRKMSVRMPGFHGMGGFHIGNSLGIKRHGTNNRRHHVDLPAQSKPDPSSPPYWKRTLKKPKHVESTESMRALALAGAERRVRIPGTKVNLEYVRTRSYKENLHIIKRARQHSDHLTSPASRELARRHLSRRRKTETGYEAAAEKVADAEWVARLKQQKRNQDEQMRTLYHLQHDNSTAEVLWKTKR